jgi:hypothetical protein
MQEKVANKIAAHCRSRARRWMSHHMGFWSICVDVNQCRPSLFGLIWIIRIHLNLHVSVASLIFTLVHLDTRRLR